MKTHPRLLVMLSVLALSLSFASSSFAVKPADKPDHQQKAHGKGHEKKAHHKNGKQLLGANAKSNGHHVLEQKGDVTASIEIRDGKVAGMQAKHAKKGDLPVKKYKSTQKMARLDPIGGEPRLMTVQDEYLGTIYIGYSYIDDDGYEEIYWFPYDMIYDGDTGAIEYVAYDEGY